MKWEKAPEHLKALISKAMEDFQCDKRIMFGYPAYFVNSYMFAGLFQNAIFIRLSPAQVDEQKSKSISVHHLEPMKGRPMKDYYIIPEILYSDESIFRKLIKVSMEYTERLPPKLSKVKKK